MNQIHLLFQRMRIFMGVVVAVMLLSISGAFAQEAEADIGNAETGWQLVITQQLDAFRAGDAQSALALSSVMFKRRYANPERFMADILSWGYAPILRSTSHSFGEYRPVGDGQVLQMVQVIGNDQGYYQALFQLGYETDGWRIQGVSMSQKQGIGI